MDDSLRQRIQSMVEQNRVLLFMKGTKTFPQCGFSQAVVAILNKNGAPFETVNVLADTDIRQGMKEFSSWPTFPQLYVDGQFVGGCDIVREMDANGELAEMLKKSA